MTARSTDFVHDIREAVEAPLALAPLGHERSADGPAGLVSASPGPMTASRPAVARSMARSTASVQRTFRNPFRRTPQVQPAPAAAASGQDEATTDDETAPVSRSAAVAPSASAATAVAAQGPAAMPARRLAAVARTPADASPGPSLVRAPAVDARVDGTLGAAMAGGPVRMDGSAAGAPFPADAPFPAGGPSPARASGPGSLAAAVLPPMPVMRPELAAAPVQRARTAASPAVDARPARLTVGQVRRLGLGTPFTGGVPASPVVARVADAGPVAPVPAAAGPSERPAAATTSARATPEAAATAVASSVAASPSPSAPPSASAATEMQRSSPTRAPLVSHAPIARLAGSTIAAGDEPPPSGAPTLSRSAAAAAPWPPARPAAPVRPTGLPHLERAAIDDAPDDDDRGGHDAAAAGQADVQRSAAIEPLPTPNPPSAAPASAPASAPGSPDVAALVSREPLVARSTAPVAASIAGPHADAPSPAGIQGSSVAAPLPATPARPAVARSTASRAGGDATLDPPAPRELPSRAATPAVARAVRPIVSRQPSLPQHPADARSVMPPSPPRAAMPSDAAAAGNPPFQRPAWAAIPAREAVRAGAMSGQRDAAAGPAPAGPALPLVLRSSRDQASIRSTADADLAAQRAVTPTVPADESRAIAASASVPAPVIAREIGGPAPSATMSVPLQREAESAPGGGAPAGEAGAAAQAVSAGGASPGMPTGDRELDDLAHRLYDRIRSRLRLELLIDRERTGRLSDFG